MPNISLYPYTLYIFFAVLLLTAVFIVYTLLQILKTLKSLQFLPAKMANVSHSANDLSKTTAIIKRKTDKIVSSAKKAVSLMPLYLAVRAAAKADELTKGTKKYRKATEKVLSDPFYKSQLESVITQILR